MSIAITPEFDRVYPLLNSIESFLAPDSTIISCALVATMLVVEFRQICFYRDRRYSQTRHANAENLYPSL
jgi:hypothetical protein